MTNSFENVDGQAAVWHYARNGAQQGPVTRAMLQELLEKGLVRPDDLVWGPGMPEWQMTRSVEGLRPPPKFPSQDFSSPAGTPTSATEAPTHANLEHPQFERPARPQATAQAAPDPSRFFGP